MGGWKNSFDAKKKLGHWKDGWKGGRMDGWMGGKAGLRIDYWNKKPVI